MQFKGIQAENEETELEFQPDFAHDAPYKVFVGSDITQEIGVSVLAYSINKHASIDVSVTSMTELELPDPETVANRKRTGFSFSRFAI